MARVFFDTNVIVYAQDSSEPEKKLRAQEIVKDAILNDSGVVSPQVMGEMYVILVKKLGLDKAVAAAEVHRLTDFHVIDISSSLVLRAIEMQDEFQLSYWDSLIIAAAEFASCDTVWSEDLNDGQRYGSVTVRNPFAGLRHKV